MALTGEEIRARLTAFAARWSVYEGSERSEAQTFLAQLFECYGTSREDVARFEHRQTGGFVDLLWPGVCLFEMKAPSEAKRLASHREQAMRYWREAAEPEQNMPSPDWVVICAFRRLEVWQPGKFPKAQRIVLDLIDLPDQYDALLFLVGRELVEADWAAILLTAPDAPLRPPHVDRGLHVRLPAAGGSPPPGAAAPAASLPEALIGQLANQLPNGGGLALSSARELPTGARVAVLLAPGLFRLDLRHLEDTLKISVRNLPVLRSTRSRPTAPRGRS